MICENDAQSISLWLLLFGWLEISKCKQCENFNIPHWALKNPSQITKIFDVPVSVIIFDSNQ